MMDYSYLTSTASGFGEPNLGMSPHGPASTSPLEHSGALMTNCNFGGYSADPMAASKFLPGSENTSKSEIISVSVYTDKS